MADLVITNVGEVMPIKGSSLLLNGALPVATGGTAKIFTEVGETIKNGVKVTDLTVTDARLRPYIVCINRPARLVNGKYINRDKKIFKLVMPQLLADGTIDFPHREIRIEDHPEMTDATRIIMNSYCGQFFSDADFSDFRLYGVTA